MDLWRQKIHDWLGNRPSASIISGVDESAVAPLLFRLTQSSRGTPRLAVLPVLTHAERTYSTLKLWDAEFNFGLKILYLPETVEKGRFMPEDESERARTIYEVLQQPFDLVVGSISAFLAPAPDPEDVLGREITLHQGETIDFNGLLEKLVDLDYDDELEVNVPGEVSRRGGIIDIYSPAHDYPVRLEFWGDTIDSMRQFSPQNQRSLEEITEYRIIPRAGMQLAGEAHGCDFFTYAKRYNAALTLVYPHECMSHLIVLDEQRLDDRLKEVIATTEVSRLLEPAEKPPEECFISDCYPAAEHLKRSLPEEMRDGGLEILREVIAGQVRQWLDSDYHISLLAPDEASLEHIRRWCGEYRIDADKVNFAVSPLPEGLIFPTLKTVFLVEKELFTANMFKNSGTMIPPPPDLHANFTARPEDETAAFADLEEGDYAIHLMYGIGIFRGIREMKQNGVNRELIVLEYRDGALIYVPVWQAGLVSRYIGAQHSVSLNSIGSKRWNETKLQAQKGIQEFAAEMMRTSAMRNACPGIQFPNDNLEQRVFEDSFPFTDTPDQIKAVAEIKADMEKEKPMDRLLCGDVGYGKTEVAIRAAYKAVSSGYQVLILVPTTILAQQHFYSFTERFAKYPYVVEMLSRFRSPKEQTEILRKLSTGGVDIIIGTHRLLGSDVWFHKLGLVVVDEEQRFGVKHKERLKRFRAEVDILTMSATPIPRTLYMSMTGVRDLSTLMTAPGLRLPVKTIISQDDDRIVIDAIRHEIQRGGQVYYIHNRVMTVNDVADKLARLMPDVRFAVGHGQMDEDELELVMSEFLSGHVDVLVATTIIESGLDIPNANTIIIERADRFGLAELYQLRGRVGRWNRQAFAYLLLPKNTILTSDARKRIAAIRRYSHLGAGFRLALRDLEIRGAGNLLGSEQSGHINSIGFELYCQLLRQTVARMSGSHDYDILPSVELNIDFICFAHEAPPKLLATGFPPQYIQSERLRVDAYRRLSLFTKTEQIDRFEEELEDRFGKLPPQARHMIIVAKVRLLAARASFTAVTVEGDKVYFRNAASHYRPNGITPTINATNPPAVKLNHLLQLAELLPVVKR